MIKGGLTIISRMRPAPKGYAILLYHRLHETGSCPPSSLSVDTVSFSEQMEYLRELGSVIPLSEIVKKVKKGQEPDRLYSAVTFDDGYADVARLGLAIFRRHSIPATIFISTAFIDNNLLIPWWDELQHMAMTMREITFENLKLDLVSDPGRRRFISYMSNKIKYSGLSPEELFAGLRTQAYSRPAGNSFADWRELRSLANSGYVEVGGHTQTHPVLSKGGLDEIGAGKRRLEDELGRRIRFFSYPFGERKDISAEAVESVKRAGFEAAVTSFSGFNRTGDNLLLLRRIKFSGNGGDEFAVNLRTGDIKRQINRTYGFFQGLLGA